MRTFNHDDWCAFVGCEKFKYGLEPFISDDFDKFLVVADKNGATAVMFDEKEDETNYVLVRKFTPKTAKLFLSVFENAPVKCENLLLGLGFEKC